MATAAKNWKRVGIVAGGGVGAFLAITIAGLYMNAPKDRVEQFGLSELLEGPSSDSDHVLTPVEEARRRIDDELRGKDKSKTSPVISGTKMMMRAISELNARDRKIKIGDVVRLLRNHPDAVPEVFVLIDTYLANNPRLASRGVEVKTTVATRLKEDSPDRFGFLDN